MNFPKFGLLCAEDIPNTSVGLKDRFKNFSLPIDLQ